jgi:hypothetical protein
MNETTYSEAEPVNLSTLEGETPSGNAVYGRSANMFRAKHPVTPNRKLGPALGNAGQLPARGKNRSPNVSPISHHSTPVASPPVSPISYHSTPVASAIENNSNNNVPPPPIKRQKTKRSRKYRKASRKNRKDSRKNRR